MEGPSAGLIPESFALLPFVCDLLKTRVLFFPILWCIQIGWQVRTAAFNFLSPWSTPRLLYMRTMSYNHAKLYQTLSKDEHLQQFCHWRGAKYPLTSSVRSWFRAWQCSPAENCVVLPQGFKFFALFDFVYSINVKINLPPQCLVVCQWLQLKSIPGRFPVSNPEGGFQDDHAEIGNKEHRQNILCFFWRTDEHWKQGCMVSCRTVQGRKRCAKRHAKPALDRAR